MADILNIPDLGRLEIIEIYDYYDQPILFACKNAAGHLHLVVAADENDQHETWLYVRVSAERLNLIRSGAIDLHDAFADPEDGRLFQVKFPYDNSTSPRLNTLNQIRSPKICFQLWVNVLILKLKRSRWFAQLNQCQNITQP